MDVERLTPDDILGVVEDTLLDGTVAAYNRLAAARILLSECARNKGATSDTDTADAARSFVDSLVEPKSEEGDND